MKKRGSGVLLPVFSLPGPFGIGVFGREAETFIDRLSAMGFSCWQVLPFNICGAGYSPYSSPSALAGNPLFIDPRALQARGLLTEEEVRESFVESPYWVDYQKAGEKRNRVLRLAFSRLNERERRAVDLFTEENPWVLPFSLFTAISEKSGGAPFYEWEESLRTYERAKTRQDVFSEEASFSRFVQCEFFSEWKRIRSYANSKGISVFGDMPIYVSHNSADVWSNPEEFQLDAAYMPTEVAGVPPDYFAPQGQLWGNPLYNIDAMKKTGYRFWKERFSVLAKLYDLVRIDHFRAFSEYYAVPATAKTAENGNWREGFGKSFWSEAVLPDGLIAIAEDLGTIDKKVEELIAFTGFPGMRVIQFGFEEGAGSPHLPHRFSENTVCYAGTHDNNTLLGWLWEATQETRTFALRYCGFSGSDWGAGGFQSASCRAVIETLWRSSSFLSVITFQDLCGFGSDTRMNVPGRPEKNWLFRATEAHFAAMDAKYYLEINRLFDRG